MIKEEQQIQSGLKVFDIDGTLMNNGETVLYYLKAGSNRCFLFPTGT